MASNVINLQAVREQFAALLATSLVGDGKPAEAVYAYQVGDFRGKSPAVVVTSGGADRGDADVTNQTVVFLEVHTFVLYALEDGSWTESQSEDRLDLLEKGVADVIKDANDSDIWLSVRHNGPSDPPDGVEIGGDEYRHEMIPVAITLWDN